MNSLLWVVLMVLVSSDDQKTEYEHEYRNTLFVAVAVGRLCTKVTEDEAKGWEVRTCSHLTTPIPVIHPLLLLGTHPTPTVYRLGISQTFFGDKIVSAS